MQLFAVATLAVSIVAGQSELNTFLKNFPSNKPALDTNAGGPAVSDCTTDAGTPGFCIRKKACRLGVVVQNGASIMNPRISDPNQPNCADTDVCCGLPALTSTLPNLGAPSSPVNPGGPWSSFTTLAPTTLAPTPTFLPTTPGIAPGAPQQPATRIGCGWRNENGLPGGPLNVPYGSAKLGEFPWSVSVNRKDRAKANGVPALYSVVGGGFLIHEKVALTAAHKIALFDPALLYVDVGNYDGTVILPRMMKKVDSFVLHEQYQKNTLVYDIAMVIIKKPVQWLPNVGYICLPPLNAPVTPGSRCFASGWGRNSADVYVSVMGKVEIPAMSRDACQNSLRTTDLSRFFELNESFMCAGGEVGIDTCKGDGGAPLSCPIEGQPGRYMAAGVLSWGMSCGLDGIPSVYVDVARVRQWIDDKMNLYGFSTDSYSQY